MQNQDIESLRSAWQRIGTHTKSEASRADNLRVMSRAKRSRGRVLTHRLSDRYLRLGFVGIFLIVNAFFMRNLIPISDLLMWCFVGYGLIMGTLSFYMNTLISRSHLTDLPVLLAVDRLKHIVRLRQNFRILGIVLCVPLLAALLYQLGQIDYDLLWGGCIGGVIGLYISICMELRTRREFNALMATFDNNDSECDHAVIENEKPA